MFGLSWITLDYLGVSRVVLDCLGLCWNILDDLGLWWISLDYLRDHLRMIHVSKRHLACQRQRGPATGLPHACRTARSGVTYFFEVVGSTGFLGNLGGNIHGLSWTILDDLGLS